MNIEEVRRAAEKLVDDPLWRGLYCIDAEGNDRRDDPRFEIRAIVRDAQLVSRCLLAELDRRNAESAERAMPVDDQWIESIGVGMCGTAYFFEDAPGYFERGYWCIGGNRIKPVRNRGELIDIVNALKGRL